MTGIAHPDRRVRLTPEPDTIRDPAVYVALSMIARATKSCKGRQPSPGSPGSLTIVQVPTAEWAEPVKTAWGIRYFDAEQPMVSRTYEYREPGWAAITVEDARRPRRDSSDSDLIARAMIRELPLVGIAADPRETLPKDLVDSVDHHVILEVRPSDISFAAVHLLGNRPAVPLSVAEALKVTPRLLGLARRPGQTGTEYLVKLRRLLEHNAVVEAVADSPRVAPDLDRLHGMSELVAWGKALARDLATYRNGELSWQDIDRGCLVVGPPGVGKTLFGRALAQTCGVPLIASTYGQWQSAGHQGGMLQAMRRTFAAARKQAPCILMIDEVDSFPDRARCDSRHVDYITVVVNELLAQIDGAEQAKGVVVIGACNDAGRLDPALVRPGRLDRHFHVQLPSPPEIEAILREHLGDDLPGVSLRRLALIAIGSSGADCELLIRSARQRARRAGRALAIDDLEAELQHGETGSPASLRLRCVHEAGHALAIELLRPGQLIGVSVNGRGLSGGRTRAEPGVEHLTKADLMIELCCILAGRGAEAVVLGQVSAGAGGQASSDLGKATSMAMAGIAAFGLDEEWGLIWTGLPVAATVRGVLAADPLLNARVRRLLDQAYARVVDLLIGHRAQLEGLAAALQSASALNGKEVAALVCSITTNETRAPPELCRGSCSTSRHV